MSGKFSLDEYVDVSERIAQFYERFPEGSLKTGSPPQFVELGGKPFVVYHAQAFRSPEDPCPTDGWAWEPVPGPTQFTKDSELMNAETAAWGRAIVALGFETKKIASNQEVQNRRGATAAVAPATPPAGITQAQLTEIAELVPAVAKLRETTVEAATAALEKDGPITGMSESQAATLIGKLKRARANLEASAGEPRGDLGASDATTADGNGASSPAEQSRFQIPAKAKA